MRFRVLDGWRGVCALCVALFHLDILSPLYFSSFVRNSWLFVDFFFVLSGFVITHGYAEHLTTGRGAFDFALRRFWRVWPLHIAVLIAFVAVEVLRIFIQARGLVTFADPPFSGPTAASVLPSNILLLHALGINDRLTWNGPSWSISSEFWTYLIFAGALVFAGFVAKRFSAFSGERATGVVLAALFAASYAALASLSRDIDVSYDLGLLRCLSGFLAGHFTYRAWRATARKLGSLAELSALALVVVFVATAGHGELSFAAPLVFSATIYVFASEQGLISAWMSNPLFDWLGRASYSIYLWHAFIIANFVDRPVQFAARLMHRDLTTFVPGPDGSSLKLILLGGGVASLAVTIAYLATVLVVAGISRRWIESPSAKIPEMLWRRWPALLTAAAPEIRRIEEPSPRAFE